MRLALSLPRQAEANDVCEDARILVMSSCGVLVQLLQPSTLLLVALHVKEIPRETQISPVTLQRAMKRWRLKMLTLHVRLPAASWMRREMVCICHLPV